MCASTHLKPTCIYFGSSKKKKKKKSAKQSDANKMKRNGIIFYRLKFIHKRLTRIQIASNMYLCICV